MTIAIDLRLRIQRRWCIDGLPCVLQVKVAAAAASVSALVMAMAPHAQAAQEAFMVAEVRMLFGDLARTA